MPKIASAITTVTVRGSGNLPTQARKAEARPLRQYHRPSMVLTKPCDKSTGIAKDARFWKTLKNCFVTSRNSHYQQDCANHSTKICKLKDLANLRARRVQILLVRRTPRTRRSHSTLSSVPVARSHPAPASRRLLTNTCCPLSPLPHCPTW